MLFKSEPSNTVVAVNITTVDAMAKMLDVLVETRQKRDRVDPKPGRNIHVCLTLIRSLVLE